MDAKTDQLMSRFGEFAGGVSAPVVTTQDQAHTLTYASSAVTVPYINGAPAGDVVDVVLEVRMQQLELAPSRDLLYSQYRPETESPLQREAYRQAVEDLGDNVPPLYVLPIDRTVTIGEDTYPCYMVYHDPITYHALQDAGRGRVRVKIPSVRHPGDILLLVLSLQQHLRQPSRLELADAVRRLAERPYSFDNAVIARHLARRDPETAEPPSDSYISNLCTISRMPDDVRMLLHQGEILFSHARLIAQRCNDDPELCAQLAMWVSQAKKKRTVEILRDKINLLRPPSGKPLAKLLDQGGTIVIQEEGAIQLQPETTLPFRTYDRLMAAKPAAIRRQIASHHVTVIPSPDPERVAVSTDSFASLTAWLSTRKASTPIRDVESMLLSFLEATRQAASEAKVLSASGTIAPIIDANDAPLEQAEG